MRSYTYSEARQNLAQLLDLARNEEVEIRRQDGSRFILRAKPRSNQSPFNVASIDICISNEEIVEAVRESRSR